MLRMEEIPTPEGNLSVHVALTRPAPLAAPVLVRVPAPVPAAEHQEQTGRASDDGAVTEAWNGPEPAEVPAEGPSLQKKPRGRPPHGTNGLPMRWDGPKEAR